MKTHAFWTLSFAALVGLAVNAGAQDSTKKDNPAPARDTVRKVSGGDVTASAASANYSSLLAAVNAAAPAAQKVATLSALKPEQIHIVDAKEFVSAANEADFAKAANESKDGLAALQAAIQKNEAITNALTAHAAKPAVTDVVGAAIADNGDVTIYFRKK